MKDKNLKGLHPELSCSQCSVALHSWKSSQLKFSVCKTGGSKGQVILFEWENSLLSPKGAGGKQQVETWRPLARGRERPLCPPWLCCSVFRVRSPYSWTVCYPFTSGGLGFSRGSEDFKGRVVNTTDSSFWYLQKGWRHLLVLGIRRHSCGRHTARGTRTFRWKTGLLRTENFSETDLPRSGANSDPLPTGFLRSLISDGSCRGFKISLDLILFHFKRPL